LASEVIQTFKNVFANYQALTILVTIALAFIGLVAKYVNDLRLAKRKERLELASLRLNKFYGPLYVSTKAGIMAFDALHKRLGRSHIFEDRFHPDDEAFREWKIWLVNVFMPSTIFVRI
jgi:hypothetical protein